MATMANTPDSYMMRSVSDGRTFAEDERPRGSYMNSMLRPASIDIDNVKKYEVVCAIFPAYMSGYFSGSSLTLCLIDGQVLIHQGISSIVDATDRHQISWVHVT